jgi:DHA1 family multidrug resistance protein-like MFS transporter
MRWRRTLWAMVGIQTISAGSFGISLPFLPLFIAQLGVHPLSSVSLWAGIVGSINFLMAAIFAPFWGSLADRVGRKPMVIRASVFGCITSALMGLSQNIWELTAARATMGMLAAFASAATALVGSQVPEDSLGFAMGWMSTAQMVGTLIGPLVGGFVADQMHEYRSVLFWTAGGTLLAALTCAAFVREEFRPAPQRVKKRMPLWKEYGAIVREREVGPLFLVLTLAQMTTLAVAPVIPLHIAGMVGTDSPWLATFAGAGFAVTGIADLIASPWLGKRSDELGYRRVLLISIAGAAIFTIPQGLVGNIWVFLALRFGVGVFLGGIIPTANAWIGRLFPPEQRGRVYGISYSASFIGMFIGPLFGGGLGAALGFGSVFVATGVLMIANFLWLALYLRPARS